MITMHAAYSMNLMWIITFCHRAMSNYTMKRHIVRSCIIHISKKNVSLNHSKLYLSSLSVETGPSPYPPTARHSPIHKPLAKRPLAPSIPSHKPQVSEAIAKPSQNTQLESMVKAMMSYWYRPQFSREEAISFVRGLNPGSFIVRDSSTVQGGYALTVKVSPKQIRQRRKMAEGINYLGHKCLSH